MMRTAWDLELCSFIFVLATALFFLPSSNILKVEYTKFIYVSRFYLWTDIIFAASKFYLFVIIVMLNSLRISKYYIIISFHCKSKQMFLIYCFNKSNFYFYIDNKQTSMTSSIVVTCVDIKWGISLPPSALILISSFSPELFNKSLQKNTNFFYFISMLYNTWHF